MDKAYEFKVAQTKWYDLWEREQVFQGKLTASQKPFSMSLPPPNITGNLHMGHALCYTLPDVLARTKRAQGFDVCWIPGVDHAGIATQIIVERQLKEEGTDRHQLGREAFLNRIWAWKEKNQDDIENQMRRLGVSVDWSRKRFTMDDSLNRAVRKVFVEAFSQGRIYRGPRMIQWDPVSQTALSDLEVKYSERQGKLWYLRYPILGDSQSIVVATTRPETMLGDTAVAVHPQDERYQSLIGKQICQPLTGRLIPVVADSFVDPAFGTGCVKVTPAHDPTDYAAGLRLQLPSITVIGFDAKMTEAAGSYQGLDRFVCRKKIIEDLEAIGCVVKIENHTSQVAISERSGAILEPLISDQWFMKMDEGARKALEVVRQGKIKFTPHHHVAVWEHWLNNIQDWCISRQLVWGHRIPAWYCQDCGHIHVALEGPSVCSLCSSENLIQDPDTLDTWFSSALWPFSILGWPENTPDLKRYFPNDVMCTSYDIIFFWVARMVMSSLTWTDTIPFKEVYFNSLVRDHSGQKMSKSKGNVIDPLEVMDEYGTDALRFTLISQSAPGTDISLSVSKLEASRNFCTKLWNAARFVQMNIDPGITLNTSFTLGEADNWMAVRLQEVCTKVSEALDHYRFHDAADHLYHLIYDDFCGTYIELVKVQLLQGSSEQKAVILNYLDIILRLLHPMVPFLTEEIHAWVIKDRLSHEEPKLLAQRSWPSNHVLLQTTHPPSRISEFQEILSTLLRLKAEQGIDPGKRVKAYATLPLVQDFEEPIKSLGKFESITLEERIETTNDRAIAVVGRGKVAIEISQSSALKNPAQLMKEYEKLQKEIVALSQRLANDTFVAKAPKEALAKAQQDLKEKTARIEQIKDLIHPE